jgi:lipopolysaccharide/colanic/teichoic acid biosynthesis glycosyltransferase
VNSIIETVRDTDIVGWQKQDYILGVILTELGAVNGSTADIILKKIGENVRTVLKSGGIEGIEASIDFYPGDLEGSDTISKRVIRFCPDLDHHSRYSRTALFLKRGLDLLGSSVMLVCLSPLLVVIGAAVKLTSKGPILFRQERTGQFGETFTFLKFRTMYVDVDHSLHENYIDEFIKNGENGDSLKRDGIFKLSGDPRVTKVGRFLRKTSLDELPQFWNVVKGDMSLVGPRPPIPYELKRYSTWHKKRILEAKPGITGLWQVEGRSQTSFDDMVRLDLQYAQNWSLRQDISLLIRTPLAVIKGNGAC